MADLVDYKDQNIEQDLICDTNTPGLMCCDDKMKLDALSNNIAITLLTTDWIGTEAPYTLRVDIDGMKSSSTPFVYVDQSQSRSVRKIQEKVFALRVDRVKTYDGYVIFECDLFKPTIDLNIQVKGA